MGVKYLKTKQGRSIAYYKTSGKEPGIVFLGGLASDLTGTKAIYLEKWARKAGYAFLRFDYSGHGQSSGEFSNGSIGEWAQDATQAILALTTGPQILVGSSMGGWIAMLLSKQIPQRIFGFVGIAAAPDFTHDSMWANMNDAQQHALMEKGHLLWDNDYGDPYIITKKLIEDGRENLVLHDPITMPFPVRLLHGSDDTVVSSDVALRILNHVQADNITLLIVKNADHRFSSERCLSIITQAIESIIDF